MIDISSLCKSLRHAGLVDRNRGRNGCTLPHQGQQLPDRDIDIVRITCIIDIMTITLHPRGLTLYAHWCLARSKLKKSLSGDLIPGALK